MLKIGDREGVESPRLELQVSLILWKVREITHLQICLIGVSELG